jgi:lipopolysaccharide/colanic/teichoic acid biosynthesis glycosyltransferase
MDRSRVLRGVREAEMGVRRAALRGERSIVGPRARLAPEL